MPAPKYQRVADAIREQIRRGDLAVGDRLPSIAELQSEHHVGYGAVHMAQVILKTEGLIEGRQGDGVYVIATPKS